MDFLKRTSIQHFYALLASFKSTIWNIFCQAISLHFQVVCKRKVEKILKGGLDWITLPSLSVKIQIMGGKSEGFVIHSYLKWNLEIKNCIVLGID